MDKDLLIFNIAEACKRAKIAPTRAFAEAGIGKDLFVHLRKGQIPGIDRIADLAAYLGVSVSDLVGDVRAPEEAPELLACWAELNEEGRERLIAYAEDLVAGGRYIKSDPAGMDQKKA